jgi:hypothetical protein
MKYIKMFETSSRRFSCNDLVVPLIDTKVIRKNNVYKVCGEYSPAYCRTVLGYDGWAHSLEISDEDMLRDTTLLKDIELRKPTSDEISEYYMIKNANKYNL